MDAQRQADTPSHRLAADGDRTSRPAWVRLAPFLGRPPALTSRQWRVLGLVAMASFFEMYDLYLFALTLKQIQADLAIPEASLGVLGSLVRLGAFPACIVALVADRVGRRKVLLGTILAYTLFTGATACAPNAETFVLLQFGARTFAVAETLLAVVVIAEEFDPAVRGWGIGAVGAIQACGAGFGGAPVYGRRGPALRLARPLPGRARSPPAARGLAAEPARDDPLCRSPGPRATGHTRPAAAARARAALPRPPGPRRGHGVHPRTGGSPGRLLRAQISPGGAWLDTGRYRAAHRSGGALAIVGNMVAGWGSDRWGRRRVALVFILGQVGWTLAYYSVSGPLLVVAWIGRIFTALGANVTLSAFGVELFPTSSRSTAAGMRLLFLTLGGQSGPAPGGPPLQGRRVPLGGDRDARPPGVPRGASRGPVFS